jgi:hypothetical protein
MLSGTHCGTATSANSFGAYFVLWVIAAFVNAVCMLLYRCLFHDGPMQVYSYIWDIKMDWGLLKTDVKYKFLRKKLSFRPRVRVVLMKV